MGTLRTGSRRRGAAKEEELDEDADEHDLDEDVEDGDVDVDVSGDHGAQTNPQRPAQKSLGGSVSRPMWDQSFKSDFLGLS